MQLYYEREAVDFLVFFVGERSVDSFCNCYDFVSSLLSPSLPTVTVVDICFGLMELERLPLRRLLKLLVWLRFDFLELERLEL